MINLSANETCLNWLNNNLTSYVPYLFNTKSLLLRSFLFIVAQALRRELKILYHIFLQFTLSKTFLFLKSRNAEEIIYFSWVIKRFSLWSYANCYNVSCCTSDNGFWVFLSCVPWSFFYLAFELFFLSFSFTRKTLFFIESVINYKITHIKLFIFVFLSLSLLQNISKKKIFFFIYRLINSFFMWIYLPAWVGCLIWLEEKLSKVNIKNCDLVALFYLSCLLASYCHQSHNFNPLR